MRILLVWKNDYPWDVRVEKIASTLGDAGHEVHILARNLRRDAAVEEVGGITVHRLRAAENRRVNALVTVPAFVNPLWGNAIRATCGKIGAELLIVRDLPLAAAALAVGEKLGIPTIFDMAEDYPAMWWDHLRGKWYLAHNYLLKNPWLGRLLEKRCVRRADHVLVVVDEARERLLGLGTPPERVSVVSNTPRMGVFDADVRETERREGKGPIVFYHGYVNKARGVCTVVRALPELLERFPRLDFVVAGSGGYLEQIAQLSRRLNVHDRVKMLGWVPLGKIAQWIERSDVCVVPHWRTRHKDSTIPNKIFDYMLMRRPVAVSDAKPLRRIVEETDCGVVFRSDDPASCAASLSRLLADAELRARLGRNGREAIEKTYNWERDAAVLREVVARVGRDGQKNRNS